MVPVGVFSSFFNKPKYALSLHFSSSVHAGFFERKEEHWHVTALAEAPFSREAPAPAVEAVRAFLRAQKPPPSVAIIASWRADFLEKPVTLPQMPDSEVKNAIKYAMEHHFSANMDECLYAWVKSVEVSPAHGLKAHQYFVYAVPKADAQVYIDLLKSLSQPLVSIVPSSIAYPKILAFKEKAEGKDFAILDIDTESSNFQIFRENLPLLARGIGVGSKAFAERRPSEAASGAEGSQEDDPANRAQIEKLQNTVLGSVDFYHQQTFAKDLARIFLCGKGARIQGLDKYLESTIEIPIFRPELFPLDRLKIGPGAVQPLETDFPDYLPVLGAFLVWLDRGPNLLPSDIQFENETRAKSKLLRLSAVGLGAVCVIVGLYFGLALSLKTKEINALKSRAVMAAEFEAFFGRLEESKKFARTMGQGEIPLLAFLKMLSVEMPEFCYLNDVDFNKGMRRVDISGRVEKTEKDPVGAVARFVQALAKFPRFTGVELTEGATDAGSGEYKFRISVKMS